MAAVTRERTGERAVEMEKLGGSGERLTGAMERFGGAGMALLPWTRHIIAVLWDQLRLLVQVIYYTFISVFQMFRFEVHVRITDDPSVTPDPSDLLFSSLFSEEGGADHTEALLSSLRGEELHGEGGIYIGHKCPSTWTATVRDWNFFVSSSETRSSDEERSAASCWSSEEEHLEFDCDESKALWESLSRSGDPYDPFCFSACISTRSKALWESEAPPRDVHTSRGSEASWETESRAVCEREESEASWETESRAVCAREESEASWETESRAVCAREESEASWETESRAVCEREESEASWETESRAVCAREESEASWETDSCSPAFDGDDVEAYVEEAPPAGRFWESSSEESSDAEDSPEDSRSVLVKRSDSDSSWSSDSSENSENSENAEEKEQNRLLWDLFTNNDPYNPLCFNNDPYNPLCFSAAEPRAERDLSSEEEEELWGGLSKERDPYHPLNFSATETRAEEETAERRPRSRGVKPALTQRRIHRHQHPQVTVRPWTRARSLQGSSAPQPHGGTPWTRARSLQGSSAPQPHGGTPQSASETKKKVRFSDELQVHVMRSWDFALRSSRRGPWEELARDRDRFRRRVQEAERTVGACLRAGVRRRTRPGPDED